MPVPYTSRYSRDALSALLNDAGKSMTKAAPIEKKAGYFARNEEENKFVKRNLAYQLGGTVAGGLAGAALGMRHGHEELGTVAGMAAGMGGGLLASRRIHGLSPQQKRVARQEAKMKKADMVKRAAARATRRLARKAVKKVVESAYHKTNPPLSTYAAAEGKSMSDAFPTLFKKKASAFHDELEKIAWDWHKFREGVADEGIPLSGAAIGAGMGGIRGAALGYAAGSGASILRSKLKGEKPSLTRKMLAAGGIGFGAGAGLHALGQSATKNAVKGLAAKARPFFHEAAGHAGQAKKGFHFNKAHFGEEALPALGATVGTGIAMGSHKEQTPGQPKTASISNAARFAVTKLSADFGLAGRAAHQAGDVVKPVAKKVFSADMLRKAKETLKSTGSAVIR